MTQLLALYKELNTIKWMGVDDGWDLAIKAVQHRILEMVVEHQKQSKILEEQI